ncbi:response regulator transcription factor [Aquifex pyrophilus]
MSGKILLVEDDRLLALSLKEFLEENGYGVDLAFSYEEAINRMEENNYTAYIIDVNLGNGDGIELIKFLRDIRNTTPALIISAMTDIPTIARGFESGADDYIKKPFDPEELLVRLRARIKEDNLCYGELIYKNGRFFLRDEEIELGEVERCILLKLLRNTGRAVHRDALLDCMKNPSPTGLRVIINTLRKKTGLNIRSVKGLGYVLE